MRTTILNNPSLSNVNVQPSNTLYVKMLMTLFVLFTFASTINTVLPFSLNRILIVLLVAIIAIREISENPVRLSKLFLYAFLAFAFVYTSLKSSGSLSENSEDYIYFFVYCLVFFTMFSKRLMDSLYIVGQKNKLLFSLVLGASLCVLLLSQLSGKSYEGDGSFRGWMVSSHSVASTCVLIFSIFLFLKVKNPLPYLTCSYFVFISNARTFLIPLAILLYFYLRIIIKNKSARFAIICLSLILIAFIFPKTTMYQKFLSTFNNQYAGDPFAGLSNGRTVFWMADIRSYVNDYSFVEKLFGRGFSWVKDVNYAITGHRLWAHNDIINLLLSVGVIGLSVYCAVFVAFIRKIKNIRLTFFISFSIIVCALVNGFYLYFPLVLSSVFIAHYQYIYPERFWKNKKC